MAVIRQTLANVAASGDCNIQDEILALGDALYQQDEAAYADVVMRLAERLSPQAKRDLSRTLRSPINAFGIFKDDPGWMEVENAIEQNRARVE